MEKEALKEIVTFELEAYCPEGADIEGCATKIVGRLWEGCDTRFHWVRSVVLDGLQALESCLVESEMEQLAAEIAERLGAAAEEEEYYDSEIEDGEDE